MNVIRLICSVYIYIHIIIINFARTLWVWLSVLDIIICFWGYLWYPSFTVILFGISSDVKCKHFHVWRSTRQPSKTMFFCKQNVCLQVCMRAKSYESHVYYVYFIRYLYMMTYISILISPIHIWIWLYVYVYIIQNLYLLSRQDDANPTDLVT